jgi:DNA repair protein RadA/Sms
MSKSIFVCQNCGSAFPKWQGQCTSCGEWNTLVEEMEPDKPKKGKKSTRTMDSRDIKDKVISQQHVSQSTTTQRRISTGITEFDRVLGGPEGASGMVQGAVMLIGGEPGIGKSTLLTQLVLHQLAKNLLNETIVYVAGEESPSQINLRINRLLEKDIKKYSTKKQITICYHNRC